MCGATVGILRPRKFTLIGGDWGRRGAWLMQWRRLASRGRRGSGGLGWLAGGAAHWEEDPERQPARDALPASCIKHFPAFPDAFSEIFSLTRKRLAPEICIAAPGTARGSLSSTALRADAANKR